LGQEIQCLQALQGVVCSILTGEFDCWLRLGLCGKDSGILSGLRCKRSRNGQIRQGDDSCVFDLVAYSVMT
jgi:hypothetical protein